MSFLIDTHAHLYAEEFAEDLAEMMQRGENAGLRAVLLPNIDVSSIEPMEKIAAAYPQCIQMMGLHPTYVKENWEEELSHIEKKLFANPNQYCAVGEIGMDLYWDKTFIEEQKIVFRRQLQWAKALKLPIAIHVRKAFDELFHIMDEEWTPDLKGVFHCYTGSIEQVKKILTYEQFYFGIGGVLTYKNAGLQEVLPHIPLNRLVLETDAPYLSPVPYRGKRNESSYVAEVAGKIVDILGISMHEVKETTSSNAIELFQLQKFLNLSHD
ncbi:MAG: hydrolase, TatD family protein [Bacteroidota bacterium]|jgi:TatD DNase family protein